MQINRYFGKDIVLKYVIIDTVNQPYLQVRVLSEVVGSFGLNEPFIVCWTGIQRVYSPAVITV